MVEDASILLASHAAELSRAIFGVLNKKHLKPSDLDSFRVAHDIAARLHLINGYLNSLPPYWIGSDVEHLCRAILHDLQAITRSTKASTSSTLLPSLYNFASLFGGRNDPTDPEMRLVTFFKVQTENARSLKGTCDNLLGKLTKDENDTEELPDSALQYFDSLDTSADFNNGILKALQSIAECDPASHETTGTMPADERDSQTLWHPARLCLHELEDSQNLILVSDVGLAIWQEFCLRTYVYPAQ